MKRILLLLSFVFTLLGKAQTTYLMNNNTAVNLTCPSTSLFYDSGGSGGNYSNSENYTKTFNVPAGSCLQVDFGSFSSESCCDRLRIYDGPNGASPLIGTYNGTSNPGLIISSGTALTFSWTSDGSIVSSGWTATVTCLSACSGTPNTGVASATSNFCGASGTVNLTSAGASIGCGITYQWQSAPAVGGPWTNIGSGSLNYSTTFSSTTYYRLRVRCNGANQVFSNVVSAVATAFTTTCSLSTYVASSIAYAPDAFAGTLCPSTDDILYSNIAMFGFPACYAGVQYWGGYIASNCAFVFDGIPCFPNIQTTTYAAPGVGTGWSMAVGAPVNGTSIPRNAILAPWQDSHPGLGGTIQYATLGVAPNRRFVVDYNAIPMFSCGTSSPSIYFTGQIKIFETTNIIEIHIGNKGICPGWNSGYAVMGLHNHDGTIYVPPVNATAHNVPGTWTMTNKAYRFTSPCANGTGPCAVLPIFFKNFYGERVKGVNKLTFETSVEENVKEFVVERSGDATTFMEIAKLQPRNTPSVYNYNDENAKPGAINYYKITAIENDGNRKSTFIYPLGDNESLVNVSGIFPNPVKGDFTMSLDSKIISPLEVKVYDVLGNVVKVFTQNVIVGTQQLKFNLSDVASGTYMLEVSDESKEVLSQHKLIKVD